ncbi:MAG: hypothetical protein RR365_14285 [Bacteroides sp.]
MAYDYRCSACGCTLDANEICDCRKEPEKRTITRADWAEAGDFNKCAKPGDWVEEDIVEEFRNCLPPINMRAGYLQVGEPYSHDYDPEKDRWRPTFGTFIKRGEHWTYCGNCFAGAITEPPKTIGKEH